MEAGANVGMLGECCSKEERQRYRDGQKDECESKGERSRRRMRTGEEEVLKTEVSLSLRLLRSLSLFIFGDNTCY